MRYLITVIITSDAPSVFAKLKITEEQKKVLYESIAKKMAPTPVKLRAGFELNCYTSEGIDAIREALMVAKKTVNEEHFKVDVLIQMLIATSIV